jgi:hypothetical protein
MHYRSRLACRVFGVHATGCWGRPDHQPWTARPPGLWQQITQPAARKGRGALSGARPGGEARR